MCAQLNRSNRRRRSLALFCAVAELNRMPWRRRRARVISIDLTHLMSNLFSSRAVFFLSAADIPRRLQCYARELALRRRRHSVVIYGSANRIWNEMDLCALSKKFIFCMPAQILLAQ